ncbi:hypothetical protein F4861DRAFT_534950 [Xylaria intraflava]|nr:hypothetical protein F4861DRAFT_534950 [Xylaria intraflava]
MSLARAFTSRRGKQPSTDMGALPQRSNTTSKRPLPASIRSKISNPMELTHTTNMLAYNAPDLYPRTSSQMPSPIQSSKSDDESCLDSSSTAMSSPPTSPEIPMGEHTCESPEPNHLSCYFVTPTQKPAPLIQEAPAIPKRAPSHTKKSSLDNLRNKHTRFSNQSSGTASTKASSTMSRASSSSTAATSVTSGSYSQKLPPPKLASIPAVPPPPTPPSRRPNDTPDVPHPFGQELEKVSELAEELGVKDKLQDFGDEAEQLIAKGLRIFTPEDYLVEIQDLLSYFMIPEPTPLRQTIWI